MRKDRDMDEPIMQKKKPTYPINVKLSEYLEHYNRTYNIPLFYDDLLRFAGSIVVYDEDDEDTLWVRVYYSEYEREDIELNLKKVYTLLHSDGNDDIIRYLNIDSIDFCTFGNSQPFRVKVRNILNDNYTNFYVKKADASRIYGLELEHIMSPDKINFLVYKDTLIEEHIMGVPGDVFIKKMLPKCSSTEKAQIAKEFVKFNERCMIRLLGDMRSYNYVIIPIHDFDHVVYKIRAIDFDQETYEGNFKIYRPQFFKENYTMVKLVGEKLQESSIEQYKNEERSVLAKRIVTAKKRTRRLLKTIKKDILAPEENINQLKTDLFNYTLDAAFESCKTMGQILRTSLIHFLGKENLQVKDKN